MHLPVPLLSGLLRQACSMPPGLRLLPLALAAGLLPAHSALAQAATAPAEPAAAAPAASAPNPSSNTAPAAPASPPASPSASPPATPAAAGQRIEITGGRSTDTEQRRQATASKIIVGREEIDKFGDATLGEVLRRLPGVTTPGAPGRGGPPRMRGLGGGFTQLLVDGQRMPPGFSLESISPEQVERIEILRAPTAETGARAIAGTINIITRDGFRVRLNDLRIGTGLENGQNSGGLNWAHNNTAGALTYNINAGLFARRSLDNNATRTTVEDADTGTLLEDRSSESESRSRRVGMSLGSRLTWRLGEQGDMLVLMPSVFHTENRNESDFSLIQTLRRPTTAPLYDTGSSSTDGQFTNARLGLQWRQRVGDVRLEANGNSGAWRSRSDTERQEFNTGQQLPVRSVRDQVSSRENSLNLTLKGSLLAGGGSQAAPKPEHSLVGGLEVEAVSRQEARVSAPDLADFGENLQARSLRLAAYGQNEWTVNPHWGAHAGLRWEGISTRGDDAAGERPSNRSSVWTPLLHAVYKPDPKGRDQVRISLTRSYRSPALGSLIARPSINRDYPAAGPNIPTAPDSAGNSQLMPELATGIDIALERYLDAGGVLSANVFHRQISNLIRGVTELETVSWSPVQRYVRRQRNIGDASTSGIELEAKFRLDQLISTAPRVEMRSNLSLYRSRVKQVPGPDNRLDQQAKASANLGADYRLRGAPFTLGGNVNWVPATTTRVEADQTRSVSSKRVWDGFVLWAINPGTGLRLLVNNIDPRDHHTVRVNDTQVAGAGGLVNERSTVRSGGPSFVNWQLRLELKL